MTVCVSRPGSASEPLIVTKPSVEPSHTMELLDSTSIIVGATLRISTVTVSMLVRPPSSVTRKPTTTEPGPSSPTAKKSGCTPLASSY